MRNVVFVAPYATANTLRYVVALAQLAGVRAAIITGDSADRFDPRLRRALAAIETVGSLTDPKALADAARNIAKRIGPIDQLFGALEQLQLPIAEARALSGAGGMPLEVVRRFRDKSEMKRALRAAGVPCARYCRATSADDAHRFADEVGYPLIAKPVDGLGTRATFRISQRSDLDAALLQLRPSDAQPVQIEEFLKGSEHTCETVSIDGKPVWSSSADYIPGPLEVLETPWIQYCVLLPLETSRMDAFVPVNHAALSALGMETGLTHMEWFSRPDGTVAVNEVGARPPGVNIMPLMSLAHGVDMNAAWVRLMALGEFDPPRRQRAAGAAFFRGQGQGRRVVAIHGLDEALASIGPALVNVSRPQIGQLRAEGYEGEGFAIVSAETTLEVKRALAKLIRNVRVVLG